MKRVRCGFTLIEVSLFLVITAAVFVGVAVGTQNSIFQQRYNDAVQNYVEFLRTIYSQVTNVQSESTGRSGWAIYGKLVTFNRNDEGGNAITSYNVIGRIGNASEGNVLKKLADLDANVVMDSKPVGFVENYTPRWASQIQDTASWNESEGEDKGYRLFTGALLIVRSPNTGTVYTYIYKYEYSLETVDNDAIDVDKAIAAGKNPFLYTKDGVEMNRLTDDSFRQEDVDFCVNPNGVDKSTLRRDIRIIKNARNASGIEMISDDDSRCGD
ncbi:hypothetical protein IKF43_00220 [Candidatus Saccharibacteria bacterium]|nr:hypothetical protein [Candidatus Saccharibacteria bacterium]